jgi:hypothetical protein
MLAITEGADEALQHIRDNLEDFPDGGGLRITAGDEGDDDWVLEVVTEKEGDDVVIDGHPLPVYLPKDVSDELAQCALDGETHGDHVHFGIIDLSEVGPEDAPEESEDSDE